PRRRLRDRPGCRRPRHPDPILLTAIPQHCSDTCRCGTRVHHRRGRRDVDPQTRRSPSGCRRRLLLESRAGLPDRGYLGHPAVAPQYAPTRARHSVIRRRNDWTNGETAALARLAATAHRRHGSLIHRPSHSLLRRQWPTPAAVAFAVTPGVLAPPQSRGLSSYGLGTETSSVDSSQSCASPAHGVNRGEGPRPIKLSALPHELQDAATLGCRRYGCLLLLLQRRAEAKALHRR